jgi:hypothetical protein
MSAKLLPLLLLLTAGPIVVFARSDRESITREIAWDGGESLVLDVPANVRFVQAPGPGKVVITGPRRSVETFSIAGGVLRDGTLRTGERLQILITAPKITRFSIKGSDQLLVEDFDQDELHLEATGRAEITASGRAGTIRLNLQGSGWADFSQFKTDGAEVMLTGGRNAIIAPTVWAKLSGNGDVVLLTQPADLTLKFGDSGRVIHTRPTTLARQP